MHVRWERSRQLGQRIYFNSPLRITMLDENEANTSQEGQTKARAQAASESSEVECLLTLVRPRTKLEKILRKH